MSARGGRQLSAARRHFRGRGAIREDTVELIPDRGALFSRGGPVPDPVLTLVCDHRPFVRRTYPRPREMVRVVGERRERRELQRRLISGFGGFISQNVLLKRFKKVNSPTKPLAYCFLLPIKTMS